MNRNQLKASFYTLGCRLNQAETALIANSFRAEGYDVVDFAEPADVCIINTCTVTAQADAKCRQVVRQALRRNPDAFVGVVGCYAQTGAEALAAIDGIDLIVGSQEKLNVLRHIPEPAKRPEPVIVRPRPSRAPFTIDAHGTEQPTTRANLKIQDGCDFMCSFCLIPFARGRARSRAFWDIQREAQDLVSAGYKELVLTGVNIGTYAFEGRTFQDVLEMLMRIPGSFRIRISSIEPTTIPETVFTLMAQEPDRLCPHLHIPLQSGSDRILGAMKRLYSRTDFLDFLERAHAAVPDILLGTDIMVGFPGETESDFAKSCDALENSPLAYAHVFTYSERPGTAATRLGDRISPAVKKRRSRELHAISQLQKAKFYHTFIGRPLRILFEEQDTEARWQGFSDNYIKVATEHDAQANAFSTATIDRIEGEVAVAAA